jgi:hypothetical protein
VMHEFQEIEGGRLGRRVRLSPFHNGWKMHIVVMQE